MAPKSLPAFVVEDPDMALRGVVRALNDGPSGHFTAEAHSNLVQLIQAWQASGPNLLKMKYPPGCPTLHEMGNRCEVTIAPTAGPRAYFATTYLGEKGKPFTPWDFPSLHFIRLITSDKCEQLGGPCRRCGNFYIKKRASQTTYCSSRCGNAATAAERTRKRLDDEHQEKLQKASKAQLEWEKQWKKGRTKKAWKEWVYQYDPDITPKFLTRAVNKGELSEPNIERS